MGQKGTLASGILLGINQLVAILSIFIWSKIGIKIGSRLGYFIGVCVLFIAFIPLLFISEFSYAIIIVCISGAGFGGLLYFTTLLSADIIDDDEIKTGIRREGTFFGITNFFMRLTGIISILTISLVFSSTGWEEYTPNPDIDVIFGLRLLMAVFPMISLVIFCICLYFYPITKQRVIEIKKEMTDLHQQKRDRLVKEKNT